MFIETTSLPRFLLIAFAATLTLTSGLTARAQNATLTTLHHFDNGIGNFPDTALTVGSDGNFYGTTAGGGTYDNGTVFQLTPAGVLTVLHNFVSTEGTGPSTALVQGTDGNFYGATSSGGPNGAGTIFSVTPAGVLTVLHALTVTNLGNNPDVNSLVLGPDGNLYGTTAYGDSDYGGEFFQVTAAGGFTVLHEFIGGNGYGTSANGLTLGRNGNFYGATSDGGFFEITTAGVLTTLSYFTYAEGNAPGSLILGSDGNFYGSNFSTGSTNYTNILKCTPTGTVTVFASIPGVSDYFDSSPALAEGSDGSFYGVLPYYGSDAAGTPKGGIFRATTAGAVTILHTFSGTDGSNPQGALVLGPDGNFYGTTPSGGANGGYGTVYSLTPAGGLTTVYNFAGGDGSHPYAGVIQGTDGNLYGTTQNGGVYNGGTLFSIATTGALTVLHNFAGTSANDGADPSNTLCQGSDGNLYGTTLSGGMNETGEIFQSTTSGSVTSLLSFDPSGSKTAPNAAANIIQGSDGNFYVTVAYSQAYNGVGTVFKFAPGEAVSGLVEFPYGNYDGADPLGPLVQGSDGNFYGTTAAGGGVSSGQEYDLGTVYKMTPAGVLTLLHSFSPADGGSPSGGLVEGADGNFYGTTFNEGANGAGTVFSITPAGVLTVLHSFTAATEGNQSRAGLILGSDGNFYGTTSLNGPGGGGTLFSITPAGALTVLHSFTGGNDGANPYGGLIEAADGNFYGTTADIQNGYGTVFQLNLHGFVAFDAASYPVNENAGSVTLTVTRTGSSAGAVSVNYSTVDGTAVAGVDYTSATGTLTWADGDATSRTVTVAVTDRLLTGGATLSFNVSLSQPIGGAAVGTPASASVTIVENDVPMVSLSVAGDGEAQFGVGKAKVIFERTGDTSTALTVSYKVKGAAQSGVDYVPVGSTLVIPAGASKARLKIKPLDDPANTGTVKVKITLLPATDGTYTLGSTTKVRISVVGE